VFAFRGTAGDYAFLDLRRLPLPVEDHGPSGCGRVADRRAASACEQPEEDHQGPEVPILHLLSQPLQEELATIAMAIETSTLDVERKHKLDRRSEDRRVSSVATSIAGWIREALANGVARRSPNCKGRQEVAIKQVLEQSLHCV
jgi:hypothetical protein